MVGQIRVELNRLAFIFIMGFRGDPVHLLRVSRPLALFFAAHMCTSSAGPREARPSGGRKP